MCACIVEVRSVDWDSRYIMQWWTFNVCGGYLCVSVCMVGHGCFLYIAT